MTIQRMTGQSTVVWGLLTEFSESDELTLFLRIEMEYLMYLSYDSTGIYYFLLSSYFF